MEIRNRIKEVKTVPSSDLFENPGNWRDHPYGQRKAMEEILQTIGIAGALTAYYSERNGGKLTLIDGHERKSHQANWPVVILDVNDDEADKLLLMLDPIRGMADANDKNLRVLLDRVQPDGVGTETLLRSLRRDTEKSKEDLDEQKDEPDSAGPPEMELQPFEHWDAIVIVCKNQGDFAQLAEKLQIQREGLTMRDGKTRKVGLNRVVPAARLLPLLK